MLLSSEALVCRVLHHCSKFPGRPVKRIGQGTLRASQQWRLHHSNGEADGDLTYTVCLSSRADAINVGVLPDLCCTPGIVPPESLVTFR